MVQSWKKEQMGFKSREEALGKQRTYRLLDCTCCVQVLMKKLKLYSNSYINHRLFKVMAHKYLIGCYEGISESVSENENFHSIKYGFGSNSEESRFEP